MKKWLLLLSILFCCPFVHGQVSNPSIIPVAGAPSGACSQNLPDQQVVVLGTVYTCQNGTWAQLAGGGGGGSPAGDSGQIQINTSGSFGFVPHKYVQQAGDTVTSIEAECSTLCIYEVTTPQAITLAASHAMSSKVWLQFDSGATWTPNGTGFVLSNVQVLSSSTLTQHFVAGTGSVALSPYNTDVPIEWFGAVGDGNFTAGTGTDNTVPINTCFADIFAGQCSGQALQYRTTAALSITRSSVGLHGPIAGRGTPFKIFTTSATADILDLQGTSSAARINFNIIDHVTFDRYPLATGTTDKGISLNHVGGYTINSVFSNNSHIDYYYHDAPTFNGVTENSSAGLSNVLATTGTWDGFLVDSADGATNPSIRFLRASSSNSTGSYTQTTNCFVLSGEAINDMENIGLECANSSYGGVITYTGGGGSIATSDIHFTQAIVDGCRVSCWVITGITAATAGSVEINSWTNGFNGTGYFVDIENSYGVSVHDVQGVQHDTYTLTGGIYANNSDGLTLNNNHLLGVSGTAVIELNNTNHTTVAGNNLTTLSGSPSGYGIFVTGSSSYNTISSNAVNGYMSAWGIFTDTGTSNNTIIGNAVDATHMTLGDIGVNGTGTALVNQTTGVQIRVNTPAVKPAVQSIGPINYTGWSNTTPSFAWELGYTFSGGTAGNNPIFSWYNGSTWASNWHVISSTGVFVHDTAVTGPSFNGAQLLSGTTGTITGTALTATCDSGTATVSGAIVGHPVVVSSTTGADVGGAFDLRGSVTSTGVVTVYVCGTGTPASLAYNVTVF